MTIKAVLFDAYGTLAHISRPTRPYLRLLRASRLNPGELLTRPVTLEQLAQQGGLAADVLAQAQADLARECASIMLYPETLTVLATLRERGFKLGVCSNLALPYAAPLLGLLPPLDATIWSFEVGYAKPQPAIYARVCTALACLPREVLMVGDSYRADVLGAHEAGLQALWLTRNRAEGDLSSLEPLPDLLLALSGLL